MPKAEASSISREHTSGRGVSAALLPGFCKTRCRFSTATTSDAAMRFLRGSPSWPSVIKSPKTSAFNPRLKYHLTDTLFGQFTHCRFKPSGRVTADFFQSGGFLEMQGIGGGSLIVAQCNEQLGYENPRGWLFYHLSGTDRRFPLLIRRENRNMWAVYGGRLTGLTAERSIVDRITHRYCKRQAQTGRVR